MVSSAQQILIRPVSQIQVLTAMQGESPEASITEPAARFQHWGWLAWGECSRKVARRDSTAHLACHLDSVRWLGAASAPASATATCSACKQGSEVRCC